MVRLEWCALDGRRSNDGLRGGRCWARRGPGVSVLSEDVGLGVMLRESAGGVSRGDGAVVREGADGSSVRELGDFGGFRDLGRSWLAFACDKLAETSFERRPKRVDRRPRDLEGEPGATLVVAGCGDKSVGKDFDLRDEAWVVKRCRFGGELERVDDGVGVPEPDRGSARLEEKGREVLTSELARHGQHRQAASRGRGGTPGGGGSQETAPDP